MDAAGELSRGESSKQPGIGGDSSEDIKGLRVLVAEDNPLAIIGLRLLTVNLGHQVVAEATTGHEAIQQAALYQPDLILMDVKMPGMNGIEATRIIMEQNPAPVILITAYQDEDTLQQGEAAGALAYLSKPITEYELKSAIALVYRIFHHKKSRTA